MPSSLFREISTGSVAVVCGSIAFVFLVVTFRTYQIYKHDNWWKQIEPPLAVTLYMIGASLYSGALWGSLHLYNQDMNGEHLVGTFMAAMMLGIAIKVCGGVMMLKQFSLPHWGEWPWVITVCLAVLMGVYCYWSYVERWGTEDLWQ